MNSRALPTTSRPIVIEGPDGSGKTTLIQQHFPNAIHTGGMAKEPDEVRRRIYLPTPGNVYDRWTAVSEQVYGIALRGRLLIDRGEFIKAIQHVRPVIIYCRPSDEIMDANLERQETKPHKDENFIESIIVNRERIRFLYDDLMSMLPTLGCLVVHYDYTKHGSALL